MNKRDYSVSPDEIAFLITLNRFYNDMYILIYFVLIGLSRKVGTTLLPLIKLLVVRYPRIIEKTRIFRINQCLKQKKIKFRYQINGKSYIYNSCISSHNKLLLDIEIHCNKNTLMLILVNPNNRNLLFILIKIKLRN